MSQVIGMGLELSGACLFQPEVRLCNCQDLRGRQPDKLPLASASGTMSPGNGIAKLFRIVRTPTARPKRSPGKLAVVQLSAAEWAVYGEAKVALEATRVPLDLVARELAEGHRILTGRGSVVGAAQFYSVWHKIH